MWQRLKKNISLSRDSAFSLVDREYPSLLTDPSISSVISEQIAQRVGTTLLVADLWCGRHPVSTRVLSSPQFHNQIMGVDNYVLEEYKGAEFIQIQNVSGYIADIQDQKAMRWAKKDFFQRNRSLWKQKFDVIFLSNILNYITEEGEQLSPWEVSSRVKVFIEKIVAKNLSKTGVLVIQNGDKVQTDIALEQNQVNEYFSQEMEDILQKYFSDFFLFWVAVMYHQEQWIFSRIKNMIKPFPDTTSIRNFSSLEEYKSIRDTPWYVTAVNVRCMQLIK